MSHFHQGVPAWAFSDDAIGTQPDRQVLVAGDNITGQILVLLLRHAGFDPLLVPTNNASSKSQLVYLWPAAARTLKFVGVDLSESEDGTTIDSIFVRNTIYEGKSTVESRPSEATEALPTVIPTAELHRLLEEQSPKQHSLDRRIETLSYRDDALLVEFTDGIREWFDVVIYADYFGGSPWTRESECRDTGQLTQREARINGERQSSVTELVDMWYSDGQLQYVPQNTGNDLLRVTTPHKATPESIKQALGTDLLSDKPDKMVGQLCEAEPISVQQVVVDDQAIDSDWWGDRRICYCGQAACAIAPASGFGMSFGIEDAIALVTELTQNDRSVPEATTAYANQRAQRLQMLLRTTNLVQSDQTYLSSLPSEPPLETIGLLRRVSLAPLFDGTLQSVLWDAPERS
jgi:2-polyprenyl-6-methoxyphenol hydroxylase-like FAD-dependent oxidoreductase